MSFDYALGLSNYSNKGICGVKEVFDSDEDLEMKINHLVTIWRDSSYTVIHTGAGISTSVGIPDFRGPAGVWTLEKSGKKPKVSVPFEQALPSVAHRALVELEFQNKVHYLITQNIDGLHLRSGFPRDRLSILHGDMFLDMCRICGTLFSRKTPSPTMGLKQSNITCSYTKPSNHRCRGKLYDTILDWEDDLPELDYNLAIEHCKKADLHICIGTSLQMFPAAGLPVIGRRKRAISELKVQKIDATEAKDKDFKSRTDTKLVIINLQPTKLSKRATLHIYAPADVVLKTVCDRFGISIPPIHSVSEQSFVPQVVLRSINSDPSSSSPWRILPHPTDGIGCNLLQTNPRHSGKIKPKHEHESET